MFKTTQSKHILRIKQVGIQNYAEKVCIDSSNMFINYKKFKIAENMNLGKNKEKFNILSKAYYVDPAKFKLTSKFLYII